MITKIFQNNWKNVLKKPDSPFFYSGQIGRSGEKKGKIGALGF